MVSLFFIHALCKCRGREGGRQAGRQAGQEGGRQAGRQAVATSHDTQMDGMFISATAIAAF